MKRNDFLKILGMAGAVSCGMKLNDLHKVVDNISATDAMPTLFMGHGSPMNAIEENEFVAGFRLMGKGIATPRAILCISAHWETKGTFVTAMAHPKTIHDFGGFPKALYDVKYPAPGSTIVAQETIASVSSTQVGLNQDWGLDHGCWSVVKHLYPNADIPVLQLSIDYTQPPKYHFELAQELKSLRNKGVLIIGSGNIVHNLSLVAWDKLNTPNYGYDWAIEAKEKINELIKTEQFDSIINIQNQGLAFKKAIPTLEHFLPLLYVLGLKNKNEQISFYNDKNMGGSLSMTSLKIDKA